MFDRPICIYSNYCKYSQEFITVLANMPSILSEFKFVCVDIDKSIKQRSSEFLNLKKFLQEELNYTLKCVPTIIVENGEFILSDKDAFEWLNHKINTINNSTINENPEQNDDYQNPEHHQEQQEEQEQEISGFNPNEMGAMSDIYSTYGLDADDPCVDAKEQCFAFLDKEICINTPDAKLPSKTSTAHMQMPQQQQQPQSKSVRFSNSNVNMNFSNSSMKNRNSKSFTSEKEKEVTNKYEQLMQERSLMDEKLKQDRKIY